MTRIFLKKYLESFKLSELGRIHAQLPLKELAEKLADVFTNEHPQAREWGLVGLSARTGPQIRLFRTISIYLFFLDFEHPR